jgi:hypothetical protein
MAGLAAEVAALRVAVLELQALVESASVGSTCAPAAVT